MKKAVSLILGIVLSAALAVPALAAGDYSDVPVSYWGYAAIMRAGELGLMEGVDTVANRFDPDSSMTRAQFIAIAVRAIGKEAEAKGCGGEAWYSGYYKVAERYGVLAAGRFGGEDADRPMNRAEMAYVVTNALKFNGESAEQMVPAANIPDLALCGDYTEQVRFAYSMGVLAGINDNGDFDPEGTLTRAAGATVAVRLKGELRQTPDFEEKKPEAPEGRQTFTEGQKHDQPREHDIIILKNGQRVEIVYKWGVLGAGIDGDIWTGFSKAKVGETNCTGTDMTELTQCSQQNSLHKNEVHTRNEWRTIYNESKPRGLKGSTDGEIVNDFWQWDASDGQFYWVGGKTS